MRPAKAGRALVSDEVPSPTPPYPGRVWCCEDSGLWLGPLGVKGPGRKEDDAGQNEVPPSVRVRARRMCGHRLDPPKGAYSLCGMWEPGAVWRGVPARSSVHRRSPARGDGRGTARQYRRGGAEAAT